MRMWDGSWALRYGLAAAAYAPTLIILTMMASECYLGAWNLLSNAIRFTAKNGQVAVRLRQTAEHVELQVEDTGAGIDPGAVAVAR